MTAIHVYDLSDANDAMEHTNAIHARAAIVALWEVQGMLRGKWEHADLEGVTAKQLIDELYARFHEIAGQVLEATE